MISSARKYLTDVVWRPSSSMQVLLGVLGLVFVVKLIMAAFLPLVPDEAYYRIWAEDLQWGYFDHPPVIAWWIRLGHELLGDNRLGTRLLPVLASVFGSLGIYWLAREFGISQLLARKSALWVQAVWTIILVGMFATPNAPSVLLWILTCACAVRATRLKSTLWWILTGCLAGLTCLSKYTGFFLAPGLLLWLVTSQRYRGQLATAGPWLAAIVAIAVFAPNIVWNTTHDWATFGKQLGRIAPESFNPLRPLKFVLEQFLCLGPAMLVLAVQGGWRIVRQESRPCTDLQTNKQADCAHFITTTSLPLIVYMFFHGFHSSVLSYWIMPLYPGIALLALLTANELEETLKKKIDMIIAVSAAGMFCLAGPAMLYFSLFEFQSSVLWHWTMLIVALIALLFLYIAGFALPVPPGKSGMMLLVPGISIGLFLLSGSLFWVNRHLDGAGKTNQWLQMAVRLRHRVIVHNARWIGTKVYQTRAYLYPHLRDKPEVVQIRERFRYPSAGASWKMEADSPGLIVNSVDEPWSRHLKILPVLEACFGKIEQLSSEYRHDFSGYRHEYEIYRVSEPLKNWLKDGC